MRILLALLGSLAVSNGLYNYPYQTHPSSARHHTSDATTYYSSPIAHAPSATPAIAGELAAPFNYRDSNRLSTGGVDAGATLGGDSTYTDIPYLGQPAELDPRFLTPERVVIWGACVRVVRPVSGSGSKKKI